MIWKIIKFYKFAYQKTSYFTTDDIKFMINNENRCIIIANSNVYDITRFVKHHPGGSECLWKKSRELTDCSIDFDFHKKVGKNLWKEYKIGKFSQ